MRSSGALPATVVMPSELARVGGDDDGDGVVVAGIAVEDDARPVVGRLAVRHAALLFRSR